MFLVVLVKQSLRTTIPHDQSVITDLASFLYELQTVHVKTNIAINIIERSDFVHICAWCSLRVSSSSMP